MPSPGRKLEYTPTGTRHPPLLTLAACHPGWDKFQDLGETVAEMSQCLIDKDGQLEGATPKGGTLPKEKDTTQIMVLPPNDNTVFVSKSEFPGGLYGPGTQENPVNLSDAPTEASHTAMGIIARHQLLQLLPRLEHGHVESINQLVWYHAQFNTLTEWHHQFCSSETRFDRYAVNPKWLAFRFGKPKKQSCPVEYLSFLVRVILNLVCWYSVHHTFHHLIEGISPPVFQFLPLTSKGI